MKLAAAFAIGLAAAPACAAENAGAAAPLVVCTPAAAVAAPAAALEPFAEPLAPLCPQNRVPQPIGRVAPKGVPGIAPAGVRGIASAAQIGLYYYYAAAFLTGSAPAAQGRFTQESPYVAPEDYHSLAEMLGGSGDGGDMIELGWTVDPGLNHDTLPHLFVFHWVNGSPTCYNGCGWVQVSPTRYPGMALPVSGTPQRYSLRFAAGKWWVGYQGEWIGYFPASIWSDRFQELGLVQWFGEVAASGPQPCTQMGDGIFGSGLNAAAVVSEKVGLQPASATPGEVTEPAYYAIGNFTGNGYRFGGPGAC